MEKKIKVKQLGETSKFRDKDDYLHKTERRRGRSISVKSEEEKRERSRQSARECRIRKGMRYQYLEHLVNKKEQSIFKLKNELAVGDASTSILDDSTKPLRKGKRKHITSKEKLERSRESARACRTRKYLRYQYLEQLVHNKEKNIYKLRDELKSHRQWCEALDNGIVPEDMLKEIGTGKLNEEKNKTSTSTTSTEVQVTQSSKNVTIKNKLMNE